MTEHRLLATAALVAVIALAGSARADDKAAAQVLFEQGRSLVLERKFADACPKFVESLRLDRGIGTMLWLADCFENNGQTASAWAQFKEAAAAAALQGDVREKIARRRAENLEARLARLTLVPPAERSVRGLEVRRDGVVVGSAELGIQVPVDPGVHTLAASAPGRRAWTSQIRIAPDAGTTSVTIPVLESDPAGGPDGPTPATTAANRGAPAQISDGLTSGTAAPGKTQRLIALVAGGAGVAAIGIGTYFGLRAKGTYDDASSSGNCNGANQCNDAGKQQRSDASTQAAVATVAFTVGAAAIAAGVVLYLTAPHGSPQSALTVAPAVGPHDAGLTLSRAW